MIDLDLYKVREIGEWHWPFELSEGGQAQMPVSYFTPTHWDGPPLVNAAVRDFVSFVQAKGLRVTENSIMAVDHTFVLPGCRHRPARAGHNCPSDEDYHTDQPMPGTRSLIMWADQCPTEIKDHPPLKENFVYEVGLFVPHRSPVVETFTWRTFIRTNTFWF